MRRLPDCNEGKSCQHTYAHFKRAVVVSSGRSGVLRFIPQVKAAFSSHHPEMNVAGRSTSMRVDH